MSDFLELYIGMNTSKKDPNEIHNNLVYYINSLRKENIKNHIIKITNSVFMMLEMNRVVMHKKMLPDD